MRPVETQDQSCLSCKFWAGVRPTQIEEENSTRVLFSGQCRKSAPVMDATGKAVWPVCDSEDWCAAYEQGTTPNDAKRFL